MVDFAPHDLEFLREAQAHRRLGFAPEQVAGWLAEAGLGAVEVRHLAPAGADGDLLTVTLWLAHATRADTALARVA